MAKKKAKAVRKAGKKAAKKAARRGGVAAKASGPRAVSTGCGASLREVGRALVEMFNRQSKDGDIWDKHFSPKFSSIEGAGVAMEWSGRKAVERKGDEWMAQNTVHGASAEGPYVGATGFAVKFKMDVESKATGERRTMEEIGVYSMKDGKVVREEFMYQS